LLYVSGNGQTAQVILLENLSPRIVSTPGVDRLLTMMHNTTFLSGVQAWTFKLGGHRFYGLTCRALNLTLVYDIDQKFWKLWTDALGNYWPIITTVAAVSNYNASPVDVLAQHESTGYLYTIGDSYLYPTDYSTVFPVDIYTSNFDAGTSRQKQLNSLYFQADQQSGSALWSQYSDDDYQSWSEPEEIDLSVARPSLGAQGSFYKRAYHLQHRLPTPLRLCSVDLPLDFGIL